MMWALVANAPSIQGYLVKVLGSVTGVTLRESHFRSRETARKPAWSFRPFFECRPLIRTYRLETGLGHIQFNLPLLCARPLGRFAIVPGDNSDSLAFIHVGPHCGQLDCGL